MPRKRDTLDRFTLRIARPLAVEMNRSCDDLDMTQREFVEAAVRDYCDTPINADLERQPPESDVYRTGMWIDPGVIKLLDQREVAEKVPQREVLERAIRHRLGRA